MKKKVSRFFFDNKIPILKNNEVLMNLSENLYVISLKLTISCEDTAHIVTDSILLHRIMGHSSHFSARIIYEVCLELKTARQSDLWCNLDKTVWGESVKTAVYLINWSSTSVLPDKVTPAEMWYGYKLNINNIIWFSGIQSNIKRR